MCGIQWCLFWTDNLESEKILLFLRKFLISKIKSKKILKNLVLLLHVTYLFPT